VATGEKANISVEVKGGVAPYTYIWQLPRNGSWIAVQNGTNYSGQGTNKLTLITKNAGAVSLRCIIKDATGHIIESQEAMITVKVPALTASITPTNITIDTLGETPRFTVKATGGKGPYTYKWSILRGKDFSEFEDSNWLKGQGTDTLRCTPSNVGVNKFRCTVTDSEGNTVVTETVSVTVDPLGVKINDGTEKYTLSYKKGETVELKANATGGLGPYTCTWYEVGFDESTLTHDWIPVHTGSSFKVGPGYSHEIRLEVKDAKGNTVMTSVWIEVIDQIN
jgi:hypothetical protein